MIQAKQVMRLIRQKEKDNDEVRFSDYDIWQAVNECIRYLNASLSNKDSEYLQKSQDFIQNDINAAITAENESSAEGSTLKPLVDFGSTGVSIPEDLISVKSLYSLSNNEKMHYVADVSDLHESGFTIFGGKIYCKHDFRLLYYGSISAVSDEKSTIDLPDIFLDPIVKLSRVVLNNGDNDTMTQAVTAEVDKLIPRRRYSNARQKMPFWM